jgi:subfamily B ATP-binding cassette protein MsbA
VQGFKYLLHRFLPYFRDYKVEFALAILGMIMAAVGTTATAYIIKPVLDKIFIEQNQELLTLLPFGVVLVYLVKGGGAFLQVYYAAYIGQDIVRRIRDSLLEKILSFEMGFFHEYRSGELISRSINDIERIRQVVSNVIPMMIREILTIIALLGYIFYLNPKMAILAIIFLPLTAAPLSSLAKKMKRLSHSSQEKLSDLTARLSEIFNNIEIIKANATEKYEHQRFQEENKKIFDVNIKATKTTELVSPMMEVVGSLAVALVIMYGGQEVIDKEMSVGSFFSFLAALFMLYTPIKRVSNMYNKMQDAIAASERIFSLLERENRVTGTNNTLNEDISKVTFKDVDLYYKDKKALSNISFDIHKGESIALVGNSGGGKSSIVNLLLRFYDVNSGKIAFNDTNINHFSLHSIRKNISIVTQRIYIFNDTVAANVAYGEEIDEEKVIHSLKQANAWDFIQKLENGIYTEINEFGTNLSGGQRQRIAIARAIYRDPKILIFDEATSALDTQSEQEITKALEKVSKDKITIIIAHRLKTIENVDRIIVLKEGKISCIGSKSELLKHCDEFKQLNGLQR